MTSRSYEELIIDGIHGLPSELLAEIADFVYFVRRRATSPREFDDELRSALVRVETRQMSRDEQAHLEEEFAGYDQRYPLESLRD
jgi:hypothetical protein